MSGTLDSTACIIPFVAVFLQYGHSDFLSELVADACGKNIHYRLSYVATYVQYVHNG